MKKDDVKLVRQAIENYFFQLNDKQKEAVLNVGGPMLILAGAGSGKTTVLINRIVNMVKFGQAYEAAEKIDTLDDGDISIIKDCVKNKEQLPDMQIAHISVNPCPPWRILAITFTNKAANELRERLKNALGQDGSSVFASTFHSFCVRVLRENAEYIGYDRHFSIYDTSDVTRAVKDIFKQLNMSENVVKVKSVVGAISRAKEKMLSAKQFEKTVGDDIRLIKISEVYKLYEAQLKKANAMDFDDLICNTILLFKSFPVILDKYKNRFRYIMIDEYQDTNPVQYELVKLLTNDEGNLCVVGDDDQSIYKFRGATIENILHFEDNFPNTKIIKLEQNYRSTKNILNAANDIIRNNTQRKEKKLWTDSCSGEKVVIHTACNEQKEAIYIVDKIEDVVANGMKYSDCAVLYRMNSQAFPIEKIFVKSGIPYRKLSGHRLTDAEEIKDVIAYLSVMNNPHDNLSLRRIINKPRRSIGDKTINALADIASQTGLSMFDVLSKASEFAQLQKANNKLSDFYDMMNGFIEMSKEDGVSVLQLYEKILADTNYIESLSKGKDVKKLERIDNILEFKSNIKEFEEENENATLEGFLEEFALISDIDNYNENEDAVVLMTVHSAKGLEFPVVFIPGFENGIFPGSQSLYNEDELQEERRLAYVALTRAKKNLYLINSDSRMIFGKTSYNKLSRFAEEINDKYINRTKEKDWHKASGKLPKYKSVREERNIAYQSAHIFNRPQKPTNGLVFSIGDKVNHKVFGEGTVVASTPMGNDFLLEINFNKVGSKKIMSNFSKLELIK